MDFSVTAAGFIAIGGRRVTCALGRSGVTRRKTEGDGATPAGCFALRRVLFRPDRIDPPLAAIPVLPLKPDDGWCNDPRDPAYNRPVTLPYPASAEALWRDDGLYDAMVILGHNDDPPIPGAGSAIFLHVASTDGAPTEGCVALALSALLALLRVCAPGDRLRVTPDRR